MVSLHHPKHYRERYSKDNFCSGSIISPHLVITAAHCLRKFTKTEIRDITIMSNSKYCRYGKSPFEEQHSVEEIMIHPDFVSTGKINIFIMH